MPRIKIALPTNFLFSTVIPIRITDMNFGGHVGNDALLGIIHEARTQYLQHYGYGELDLEGLGVIMSDVGIEFKRELFYGDALEVWVVATEFSKVAFEIYYRLESTTGGKKTVVATAKTGMVCYDYSHKRIAAVPPTVIAKLSGKA